MAKKSVTPREPKRATLEIIPEDAPEPRKTSAKAKKSAAVARSAGAARAESTAEKKPKAAAKPRKAKVKIKSDAGELVEIHVPIGEPFEHPADDPIGDVTDGEAHISGDDLPESASEPHAEMAAYRAETTESAIGGTLVNQPQSAPSSQNVEAEEANQEQSGEDKAAPELREPPKLDRLQKILSQAGIASRRRAEELITEGRVQVNGQVVTQLGAKADAARDHIRVDGKLISEAERHRYFVLNKPKGFVTTVSDPEGRPTVMEFFSKMRERLYPVGRLDYQSEGLLLVTNDGELANQLTRAASGVEKTYLVKVAGQPTEEQLDILRSGVAIDREQPGSGKVHTAPAQIRQVRRGDNPWFEVVLIEGRNRELRKMFSAIGHFVEKIRRVGYGPLVLDLEPGKLRELEPEELAALRLAAEGKWKPRRPARSKTLPKDTGQRSEHRAFKPGARLFRDPAREKARDERDSRPREQPFGGREERPRGGRQGFAKPGFSKPGFAKPGFAKPGFSKPGFSKPGFANSGPANSGPTKSGPQKSKFDRPQQPKWAGERPRFERAAGDMRPQKRFGERDDRPRGGRPGFSKPGFEKSAPDRPQQKHWDRERPRFGRDDTARARGRFEGRGGDFRPQQRESEPRFEEHSDPGVRQHGERPYFKRPAFDKTQESPRRFDKREGKSSSRPRGAESGDRPGGKFGGRFEKPAGKSWGKRPAGSDTRGGRPGGASSGSSRPESRSGSRSGSRPGFSARPGFKRSGPPRGGSSRGGPPRSGGRKRD